MGWTETKGGGVVGDPVWDIIGDALDRTERNLRILERASGSPVRRHNQGAFCRKGGAVNMTTMRERCEELNLREKGSFDYALPQYWVDHVMATTGLFPNGVVWLYDEKAPAFGRPYAVSMYGWWVLKLYEIKAA
jgi:hypothetical protein